MPGSTRRKVVTTPVIMPKFGMAQEDATVIAWLYQAGDQVEKGVPILEVETDKTTMEVEAPATGILRDLRAQPGDVVPVTQIIAYILKPGESLPPEQEPSGDKQRPIRSRRVTPVARRMAEAEGIDLDQLKLPAEKLLITRQDVEMALTDQTDRLPEGPEAVQRLRATPAARRVAREHGLDLTGVTGRGPRGRIQAADLLEFASAGARRSLLRPSHIEPLVGKWRTIAARMTQSYQSTPHFTLTVDADMTAALDWIQEVDRLAGSEGPQISVTALLVKVCATVLASHPRVNSAFFEDGIRVYTHANIGLAVALEDGLIVPVIHQADTLSLSAIASRLGVLIARARQGALTPDDVYGGTFTISNLGMYGIRQFTAIINPPQSAILAVGMITRQPVVEMTEEEEAIVIRPRMALTLAVDHRTLDGAMGALFLQDVVAALENPTGHKLFG
jgi:pyruvate dehydrogenase E2 component (dihydrolipoamide acetyltransferase)